MIEPKNHHRPLSRLGHTSRLNQTSRRNRNKASFSLRSALNPAVALGAMAVTLGLLSACGGAPPVATESAADRLLPERLYPLNEGRIWSYNIDTGEATPVLAITRVTTVHGNRVEVQNDGGDPRVYETRPEGIYRTASETWLLRTPVEVGAEWPAPHGATARVRSVTEAVETPSGNFTDCASVEESGGEDGKTVVTVYCTDVGPVMVMSSQQLEVSDTPVSVTGRLLGFTTGDEL